MTTMQSMPTQTSNGNTRHGGHLYMQTNEVQNAVIHYLRSANGTITEVDRVPTGGAGSGLYKPISGQENAPNAFARRCRPPPGWKSSCRRRWSRTGTGDRAT